MRSTYLKREFHIFSLVICAVLLYDGGCGSDDNLTGQPPVGHNPVGYTEGFNLNTCREFNGVLVYAECSQARADAACQEFGYQKAISYQCIRDTCVQGNKSIDTTYISRVICWKP